MTYYKTIVFFIVAFFVCLSSYAQQKVQTPKDLYVICRDDGQFVGKPLNFLLKEIMPPIIFVFPREGSVSEVAPLFTFFFTSVDIFNKYRQSDRFPLRLTVYLREPYKWDWEKCKNNPDRQQCLSWTKEDAERYGNLSVTAIRVAGEFNECDY